MKTLFINGSPNKEGNTVRLAETLLAGKEHATIHLVDCKIYGYGQNYADDELHKVLEAMETADTIVVGSPVYWHNMSGAVRNLLDRLYGALGKRSMTGKRLFFLFQGAAPEKWMLEAGEYSYASSPSSTDSTTWAWQLQRGRHVTCRRVCKAMGNIS